MSNSDQVLQAILRYERTIKQFNSFISDEFNLEISPLLAKRKKIIPEEGCINVSGINISYKFHGMGCGLNIDGIQVEFDYSFDDFVYRGFELDKLFLFISTEKLSNNEIINRSEFDNAFSILIITNEVMNIRISPYDTYDYVLNTSNI
jgi:hypothetical protein